MSQIPSTKENMHKLSLVSLKQLAKDHGITGYSKYKSSTKDKLIQKIWDKMNESIGNENVEIYNKEEVQVREINVKLTKLTDDSIPLNDDDKITPEMLVRMLSSDDFVKAIISNLLRLYSKKADKYTSLSKDLQKKIKADEDERAALQNTVDTTTLKDMFPMLSTNKVFLVKIDKLKVKALERMNYFIEEEIDDLIDIVRADFLEAIENEEKGIMSITGDTRAYIRESLTKQLYILSKSFQPYTNTFLNMVFTGSAGVGKTFLASTVGFVYSKSGILLNGDTIVASPADLVAGYVGQTAPKTAGVLRKGLENIIFIDEAYQIMPCKDGKIQDGTTFGTEAITEIVNFLDKYIGLSIMIVAGYKREIDGAFFAANEGLQRRFPIRYPLPSYSILDLYSIFTKETVKRLGEDIFCKYDTKYILALMQSLSVSDKNIFINQAGDIINLSARFVSTYYGSVTVTWGEHKDNKCIINAAFNSYLSNKGYRMSL